MVSREIITAELKDALKSIENKHNVVIILREVDIFDAEHVRLHGIPETRENKR